VAWAVEGTRHYGLGLARHLAAQSEHVSEIDCSRHIGKRRAGKHSATTTTAAPKAASLRVLIISAGAFLSHVTVSAFADARCIMPRIGRPLEHGHQQKPQTVRGSAGPGRMAQPGGGSRARPRSKGLH
jgi:hypothetical protein